MRPHEECKDTYKGPVCNCKHGYKRKHGHCVGKKITDKHGTKPMHPPCSESTSPQL
jgi:hypothetical protein